MPGMCVDVCVSVCACTSAHSLVFPSKGQRAGCVLSIKVNWRRTKKEKICASLLNVGQGAERGGWWRWRLGRRWSSLFHFPHPGMQPSPRNMRMVFYEGKAERICLPEQRFKVMLVQRLCSRRGAFRRSHWQWPSRPSDRHFGAFFIHFLRVTGAAVQAVNRLLVQRCILYRLLHESELLLFNVSVRRASFFRGTVYWIFSSALCGVT